MNHFPIRIAKRAFLIAMPLTIAGCSLVNEATSTKESMMPGIVTAIVSAIIAGIGGFAASEWRKRDERIKEWERVRSRYLTPFRITTPELRKWLEEVVRHLRDPNRCARLLAWFQRIKDDAEKRQNVGSFFWECNGELYFAAGTMYATARHFALSNRVRNESPYLEYRDAERKSVSDETLLDRLNGIRDEFSGEDGLWGTLQESIGFALTKADGTICSYREFCQLLVDEREWVWLLRLIDFFRDIGNKADKLERIAKRLDDLNALIVRMAARRIRW